MRSRWHSLWRHAVDAAKIAAVGDREAKVVHTARGSVQELRMTRASARVSHSSSPFHAGRHGGFAPHPAGPYSMDHRPWIPTLAERKRIVGCAPKRTNAHSRQAHSLVPYREKGGGSFDPPPPRCGAARQRTACGTSNAPHPLIYSLDLTSFRRGSRPFAHLHADDDSAACPPEPPERACSHGQASELRPERCQQGDQSHRFSLPLDSLLYQRFRDADGPASRRCTRRRTRRGTAARTRR